MKFDKIPLTFEQQADLLLSRGLKCEKDILVDVLKKVNYYRLSAYWLDFRNKDDSFKKGITLDIIRKRYTFDRQLRLLIIDAIERVEIYIRTQLVNILAIRHGTFSYRKKETFPNLDSRQFKDFQKKIDIQVNRSKKYTIFVKHFFEKYDENRNDLPVWMLAETLTFGTMYTMFRGVSGTIKQEIAESLGIKDKVLNSWLRAINAIRNTCAHHDRLWNRELGYKILIPNKDKKWHEPVGIPNNKLFAIFTILNYSLSFVAPNSNWKKRLLKLFNEYKELDLHMMGFPLGWQNNLIWKD